MKFNNIMNSVLISLAVLGISPIAAQASSVNPTTNNSGTNLTDEYAPYSANLYNGDTTLVINRDQLYDLQNDYASDLKTKDMNTKELKINKHNLKWIKHAIKSYKHKKHHTNKYLKKNKKSLIRNIKKNKQNAKHLDKLLAYETNQINYLNGVVSTETNQMNSIQKNPFTYYPYEYDNQYFNWNGNTQYGNQVANHNHNSNANNYYYTTPNTRVVQTPRVNRTRPMYKPIRHYKHIHRTFRRNVIRNHFI